MTVPTTIIANGNFCWKEAVPAAAFNPGHLVELTSSGTFQKHSTAAGVAEKMIAVENDLEGKDVTDAYGTSDRARAVIAAPGAEVNMKIKNGEDIAIGDKLASAGNGELQEALADSSGGPEDTVLAVALAAVDMSDSSGVDPDGWCRVRIL